MLETRLRDIPNLITVLINASVSMGRIGDFMSEPDRMVERAGLSTTSTPIQLESCSYAWPGAPTPVLTDISLNINTGLTVVSGKVGAGKTALLQALLGELDKVKGVCNVPDEMIGYCAQTPWLQSMSIRENILFSSPYDERRYRQVLDACALVHDLDNFKHGDSTFIGENGTGLSGGQKARVALARGVYSSARILLLDDPLSALDFNTAESVVGKCLSGPLMRDRTVVLVTHRTTLVRDLAQQIIEIDGGRATAYDKDSLFTTLDARDNDETAAPPHNEAATDDGSIAEEDISAPPDKFIEEEHRAEWGVKSHVYWNYVKAGRLRWWVVLVALLTIYRLSTVAQSWFLKDWGESYENHHVIASFVSCNGGRSVSGDWFQCPSGVDGYLLPMSPIGRLPPPDQNVIPWLWAFLAITTFQTVNLLVAALITVALVYYAGKTMFEQAMTRVSHATFRYFDVTPVGRLMNRLTSDMGVVDGNISQQFQQIAFLGITWVTSIVVIASVTPSFLIFSVVLSGAFVFVFLQFLPTSQSLRRLEMVSLSPLLSNFGELLHGLTTVRAFHAEMRFLNRVIEVVDKFQGMDHFYWSLQAWLMYRFEGLSAVSTFCLTVLALYSGVSAGLIAFLLIAADNFVTSTHGLCKQYGKLQMDFVSVERVDELLHLEQEPRGTIEPPAAWPRFGSDIVFEDVTVRYAPHLDPALSNISLRIRGGSSTAVVGRTGSGKSTLALSLLNVVQPDSGRVMIDNINIAEVDSQALRQRVTFVAQEPVLFPGTIRLNLDPVGDYSDEECGDVLSRICSSRHGWTLNTQVEAGGRNLSHGQRQLIGLSRAVLRRSPIVILDEATASIDHETSLEIQQIIRDELRESTVVTVAHRLEAIRDADYYVVLDQGTISKQGSVGEG
jgi:ABC-type multidrug transport system fused ATPase/permease subunit